MDHWLIFDCAIKISHLSYLYSHILFCSALNQRWVILCACVSILLLLHLLTCLLSETYADPTRCNSCVDHNCVPLPLPSRMLKMLSRPCMVNLCIISKWGGDGEKWSLWSPFICSQAYHCNTCTKMESYIVTNLILLVSTNLKSIIMLVN